MKIFRYVCMAAVLVGVASCQKDLPRYSGDKPDIYFSFAALDETLLPSDSAYVAVLENNSRVEERVDEIRVSILGEPVGYDRTFKIEPVAEDIITVGEISIVNEQPVVTPKKVNTITARPNIDYVVEECVIPADSIWGVAKIRYKRTPELDAAGSKGLRTMFKLVPNEHFNTNFPTAAYNYLYSSQSELGDKSIAEYFRVSALTFKVNFNNASEKSDLWNTSVHSMVNAVRGYFGEENPAKIAAFIEYGGYSYEDFYPSIEYVRVKGPAAVGYPSHLPPPADAQCWSFYVTFYMADYPGAYSKLRAINKGLSKYKAEHGGQARTYVNDQGQEVAIELGTNGKNYQ